MDGVGFVTSDVFLLGGACAHVLDDGTRSHFSERQCSVQW